MFRIDAPITMVSAGSLLSQGERAIESGESDFSLAELNGSDSAAIAVLLAWQRSAAKRGMALVWHDVPDVLSSLASLYGVSRLLPGFPLAVPILHQVPHGALPHQAS